MPKWSLGSDGPVVIHFHCCRCGVEYAAVSGFPDRAPFHQFKTGLCATCPADRFNIPLSLECIELVGWQDCDEAILEWQSRAELSYYDHPTHPRNSLCLSF